MISLATTYFGSVEWFATAIRQGGALVEAHENYQKQTLRNRCAIATANGVQHLTVPITLPSIEESHTASPTKKMTVGEVMISDHGNWRHQHWEALCSAYGQSPFFLYYADDIKEFFEPQWTHLLDYNLAITRKILDLIGADIPVLTTDSYQGTPFLTTPDDSAPLVGRYYQTFHLRHGFIPRLSILDLLFNEGPESILFLRMQ